MALTPGTRLGVYEVTAQIGEGGMGQVYRARDTKLHRDVALKVLPDSFASDTERLARFTREAQTLASLNHPNIAHIHGLEESSDVRALVMELVEGEDLSQRIARGAIPLAEALPIAKQIAEALEAAHEQGIIHRDLKPANVKVREDGTAKVLDFGLAKAMAPTGAMSPSISMSPTITTPAMTQAGMILGTAAYMSPEQAKGRAADRRSDVWAFGVLLYEMLTGQRAFKGEDVSDTLAAILRSEPDWTALPVDTPPLIRRLLRRCLEKDRKRRLDSAADARLEIEEALTAPSVVEGGAAQPGPEPRSAWLRALPCAVAGLACAAVATVLVLWAPWQAVPIPATVRLSAAPGADATLAASIGSGAILSPDGTTFAFVGAGGPNATPQIFVRRLDQLRAMALQGTDNASSPFYSPDGHWIAFFAAGKLKKVAVSGGAVVTIANAANPRGGTWADDGSIVFAAAVDSVLSRVSSGGGNPVPATAFGPGETSHRWPQALGGRAILYSASDSGSAWETASLVVQQVPLGSRTVVRKGAYYGRYLPNGYLVYIHDGVLFGAPFDAERLQMTRMPVPVLEGIATNDRTGGAQVAFSQNGTLVYVAGQSGGLAAPMVWMNMEGQTTTLRTAASDWSNPQFSPNGSRLAMDISDGTNTDVWVYDWARDAPTRMTFDPTASQKPVWTSDGRRITFSSARADKSTLNLYWQRADGAGDPQRLTDSKNPQLPGSWHPSGKYLAFSEGRPHTKEDLMILPMEGDDASGWKPGSPTVFLSTPATETEPMFSPDGRWIAYQSNESGTIQVYVRPFPGPGGKWQISGDGGGVPTWSRTRPELFYRSIDGRVMVASYKVEGDSFFAAQARPWSSIFLPTRPRQRSFDLHPDGDRIAASGATQENTTREDKVVFVFNFFDDLRRLAPTGRR